MPEVLERLVDYANSELGIAWPSPPKLVEDLDVDRSDLERLLRVAEKLGLIERESLTGDELAEFTKDPRSAGKNPSMERDVFHFDTDVWLRLPFRQAEIDTEFAFSGLPVMLSTSVPPGWVPPHLAGEFPVA